MFVSRLEDPRDIHYPFDRELYEDMLVIYHGTWSGYCPEIEHQGFMPDASAHRLDQIRDIVKAYDAIGIGGDSLGLIKGLVPGILRKDGRTPAIYFSQGFWHARDYATNDGGETVSVALKAADEFLQMVDDLRVQMLHSREMLASRRRQVMESQRQLRDQRATGHPVVYAVRVERHWFRRWKDPYEQGGFQRCCINLRCEERVPPERILARADYVNGARPGYENHSFIPKTWEEARGLRATDSA